MTVLDLLAFYHVIWYHLGLHAGFSGPSQPKVARRQIQSFMFLKSKELFKEENDFSVRNPEINSS